MTDTRVTKCFDEEELESDPELFMDEDGEMQELAYWSPMRLQKLWEKAIEVFPHELDKTGIEQGTPPENIECDEFYNIEEDIEYSVEYIFKIGKLADADIMAGGWIYFRMDVGDDEPHIYGWFGAALNGDWHEKDAQLLGEHGVLETWFNNESEEWSDLMIGSM